MKETWWSAARCQSQPFNLIQTRGRTLVVLPDTWKINNLLYACLLQHLLGTNTRAFEDGG